MLALSDSILVVHNCFLIMANPRGVKTMTDEEQTTIHDHDKDTFQVYGPKEWIERYKHTIEAYCKRNNFSNIIYHTTEKEQ